MDGIDQRVGVRSFRISAPGELAVLDVVGADPAANAEFAAGNADQNLVLVDERRVGAGLALAGFAIHHRPDFRAGLGIERDQRGVGLMQEDLAVGVGDAAVDRVAAHDRDDVGILPGFILPEDLAVVVQVERIDGVRERRMHIHRIANHQRSAFVTAKHAGRERPGDLQLAGVGCVDLIELGKARIGVVALLHHPLLRILGQLVQGLVSACGKTLYGQEAEDRSCHD